MSTSIHYHTQGVRDFEHVKYIYKDGVVEEVIRRKQHKCPLCGSTKVSAYRRGTRIGTGLPIGCKTFWLHFDVHTITCSACGKQTPEPSLPEDADLASHQAA